MWLVLRSLSMVTKWTGQQRQFTQFCAALMYQMDLTNAALAQHLYPGSRSRTPYFYVAAIRSGIRFATLGVPKPVTASQPVEAE
jgi:hypothetical protein